MRTNSTRTARIVQPQRRRHVRFQLKSRVKLQVLFHSNNQPRAVSRKNLQAVMLDISQGGMLLLTSAELWPQDFLAASFEVPGLTQVSNVLGKVKRVEKNRGKFLAGIEFCDLADFYSYASIQSSGFLPKNLESFRNKMKDFFLRQKLAALL